MHRFYFNECLPSNDDLHRFVALLSATILEFTSLKKDRASIASMVVTEKMPDNMTVCGRYSLADALRNIESKDLRTIAFSIFDKSYPINAHFNEDEVLVEDILLHEYKLVHEQEELDATNLAIVAKNNGLLFSVSINKSLSVNSVTLQSKVQDKTLSLVNLYGFGPNTAFVSQYILDIDKQSFSKFELLRHTLGPHEFNNTFEKSFMSLSLVEQDSIIEHFSRAKARQIKTPFGPDGFLIKDVTPQNGKLKVFELRIFSPTALRIYFHQQEDKIFIASVEHKSNADQNSDIVKAEKILYRLTLVS